MAKLVIDDRDISCTIREQLAKGLLAVGGTGIGSVAQHAIADRIAAAVIECGDLFPTNTNEEAESEGQAIHRAAASLRVMVLTRSEKITAIASQVAPTHPAMSELATHCADMARIVEQLAELVQRAGRFL